MLQQDHAHHLPGRNHLCRFGQRKPCCRTCRRCEERAARKIRFREPRPFRFENRPRFLRAQNACPVPAAIACSAAICTFFACKRCVPSPRQSAFFSQAKTQAILHPASAASVHAPPVVEAAPTPLPSRAARAMRTPSKRSLPPSRSACRRIDAPFGQNFHF